VNSFGVRYYKDIVLIRDEILKLTAMDYLQMPDVKGFFRRKAEEED
jgi:ATP:corrinoid adenosyltransferase